MLGHSPISLCPSVGVSTDSLVKYHAFGRDEEGMGGGGWRGLEFCGILLLVSLAVFPSSCLVLELWCARFFFYSWLRIQSTWAGPPTHVCHYGCGLLAPKRGSKPNLNHGRGKPHQPPWGIDDTNSKHYHIKTPLEQRIKHTESKVHMPWPDFFPFPRRSIGMNTCKFQSECCQLGLPNNMTW